MSLLFPIWDASSSQVTFSSMPLVGMRGRRLRRKGRGRDFEIKALDNETARLEPRLHKVVIIRVKILSAFFLFWHSGLSFSVNSSASNKNAPFFPSNSAESNSDTSDNELDFSFGGTPSLIPMQSRTTQGSMGTTYGLQTTGSVSRTQQPMAEFDWTSSADLK